MAKFVILESSEYMNDLYIKVIKKYLYTSDDYCEIISYDKYNIDVLDEINSNFGNKVYIINISFDKKDGFSVARNIRKIGDVESQIVIICPSNYKLSTSSIKNSLVLNVIKQDENCINNLYNSIVSAHKILMRYAALTFSSFDEIYRIPYDSIYMVEKDYRDDSVTIYTKDDSINRYTTIKSAMVEMLNDPRFFKCNRSCIINLHKVKSYDCVTNTIYFDNNMATNHLSTREKSNFKERLKIYKS